MPATSKAQQRFMGMVHAVQAKKMKAPSKEIAEAAKDMSPQDAKDFAKTKHTGLPEHVKKAVSELAKGIKEEAEHTENLALREKITRDHLKEEPHYYSKLEKCMKKATCTEQDPNTPESFDKGQPPIDVKKIKGNKLKKAFDAGFMKAACDAGLSEGQAIDLLKEATIGQWLEQFSPAAPDIQRSMLNNTLLSAGATGAAGAGLGGLTGYLAGKNKQNPQEDHSIRDSILGALAGGGLGALGGGASTMAREANDHPQLFNNAIKALTGTA